VPDGLNEEVQFKVDIDLGPFEVIHEETWHDV
jgi:hypothetical protein